MNNEDFGSLMVAFLFLFLSFLTIQQFSQNDANQQFGGLGIAVAQLFDSQVENNKGSLVVLDVIKGTPAFANGIQKGDLITHIDNESVKGKDFKYLILEKLRGTVGTKIDLKVKRGLSKSSLNITLTRGEIKYSTSPEKKSAM